MFDEKLRYGLISRALHWSMALLFAWQFVSAILHAVDREAAITKFFWSSHGTLGFALLVLVALRGLWGLLNARSRPSDAGTLGKLAHAGHLLIYVLMLVVPALALLRTYGSGRGFSFFGLEIFAATGEKNAALMAPGNQLHGLLGWVLLAVIAGHVLMVIYHQWIRRDQVLTRMAGSYR